MRDRTWKILELGIKPNDKISLCCPECEYDAFMPMVRPQSPIIAAIALGLIFDNPGYVPAEPLLPKIIECRMCHRIYERD